MRFSYTMPDGRRYVVAHSVMVDYSLAHKPGDAVKLRVDPSQPRRFEVGPKDFAGNGQIAGAVGMLLAVGAGLSFWQAYWRLLEAALASQTRQPRARPPSMGASPARSADHTARPDGVWRLELQVTQNSGQVTRFGLSPDAETYANLHLGQNALV